MPRHNPSLVGAKLSHQSARTPKQIRNLLSRRASSKRFPATITASSSQAFTRAETDTIKPARIGQGRCPRDARSRSRGARQAWAQRERQRERIKQKRLIPQRRKHRHHCHGASAVDGAHRPVEEAAVDQLLASHRAEYAHIHPANKAVNAKPQKPPLQRMYHKALQIWIMSE